MVIGARGRELNDQLRMLLFSTEPPGRGRKSDVGAAVAVRFSCVVMFSVACRISVLSIVYGEIVAAAGAVSRRQIIDGDGVRRSRPTRTGRSAGFLQRDGLARFPSGQV